MSTETQPAIVLKQIGLHPDQVAWLNSWAKKTDTDFTKVVRSFVDAMIQNEANGIKPERALLDEQTRHEYIVTLNVA